MATEDQRQEALAQASERYSRVERGLREALDIADELAQRSDGACVCGVDIMKSFEHHGPGCRYAALRGIAEP